MLPHHLSQTATTGILPNEPLAQFEIGSYRNFVYLIIDWDTRAAVVVDPQEDLGPILEGISKYNLNLEGILLTHTHHDHVAGVAGLLKQLSSLKVRVHADDRQRLKIPDEKVLLVRDGDRIALGKITLRALHTPGHSPGEICYFVETSTHSYLLSGDTLFIRDCGRTDFEGGSNVQMFESLGRIKELPPETIILPGHHYQRECASTLSIELIQNAPLRCRSVQELESLP